MMTIDELFDARDNGYPVMITAKRARQIVVVEHRLEMSEFQNAANGHVASAGGMICAATLYEWLGY